AGGGGWAGEEGGERGSSPPLHNQPLHSIGEAVLLDDLAQVRLGRSGGAPEERRRCQFANLSHGRKRQPEGAVRYKENARWTNKRVKRHISMKGRSMSKTLWLAMGVMAASGIATAAQSFKSDDEKTFYALGVMLGKNLRRLNPGKAGLEIIKRGISDGASGAKPQVPVDEFRPKIDALHKERSKVKAEAEQKRSQPFLAKAAAEPGAVKTSSG